MVSLSDWVEYNFGRLIPYISCQHSRACMHFCGEKDRDVVLVSNLCMYSTYVMVITET
jgi:hypothetical protein